MTDRRFESVADIIAFAIRREIDAADGYAKIAGQGHDARAAGAGRRPPPAGGIASRLARGADAERTLRKLETSFTPDLHVVDALADEPLAGDMSIQDMLIFAAKKEARPIALYESLARLAGASGTERVFLFLAGQEREHKLKIEAEYETTGPSGELKGERHGQVRMHRPAAATSTTPPSAIRITASRPGRASRTFRTPGSAPSAECPRTCSSSSAESRPGLLTA